MRPSTLIHTAITVLKNIGDLLFATVNVARHLGRDPEQLLRQANRKFTKRFNQVEVHINEQQHCLKDASLAQMEAAWQKVKSQE